jgi:DNA-binding LytR/AlgR family response regulator
MIRAISVDDEPGALEVISILSSKLSSINLVKSFTDPAEALEFLKSGYVDLIFLDINMPGISGIQFIKKLTYKPSIVFTTAYSEYALESYDYDVVDYLLKPIELDRFRRAVEKVDKVQKMNAEGHTRREGRSLFLKDGYRNVRIETNSVLFIRGEGNYLQIVCENSKSMVRMTFDDILIRLQGCDFMRIHNSYIINLNRIDFIQDNQICIGKEKIPIGTKYRIHLDTFLSSNR